MLKISFYEKESNSEPPKTRMSFKKNQKKKTNHKLDVERVKGA